MQPHDTFIADMGSIDLDTFQLMTRDGQRAVWVAASDADRRGLALQIIRSRNIGPDAATITLYLECCESKFGSDQAIPPAAELAAACANRVAGHMAARYDKLAQRIADGARLAWSSGVLLVASPSGALYRVGAAGCDCPNSRAARPSCWHLLCRSLLLELLDERAALADEADDEPSLRSAGDDVPPTPWSHESAVRIAEQRASAGLDICGRPKHAKSRPLSGYAARDVETERQQQLAEARAALAETKANTLAWEEDEAERRLWSRIAAVRAQFAA